jgi:hypothetical protein
MVAIINGCVPREARAEAEEKVEHALVAIVAGCVLSEVCTEEEETV